MTEHGSYGSGGLCDRSMDRCLVLVLMSRHDKNGAGAEDSGMVPSGMMLTGSEVDMEKSGTKVDHKEVVDKEVAGQDFDDWNEAGKEVAD